MIKLIATDLDGTLLDDAKNSPPNFWETVDTLSNKGVNFAIASGRTLRTLTRDFNKNASKLIYIASNGAVILQNEEILFKSVIDKTLVQEIISECENIRHIHLAVSSATATYMLALDNKDWHKDLISLSFGDLHFVDRLQDINDDIVQIALCDSRHPNLNSYPILDKKFGSKLEVTISGDWWMDFTNKGISKGVAINALQDKFSITPAQTMVFGDYDNDISMLQAAEESYVMQNAPDYMFKYGKKIAPSNNDNGVFTVINNLL